MIKQFSKVRVIMNEKRMLNDSMISWIKEHIDGVYKVEKIVDNSVKLFKVDFWISIDLLEEVK